LRKFSSGFSLIRGEVRRLGRAAGATIRPCSTKRSAGKERAVCNRKATVA